MNEALKFRPAAWISPTYKRLLPQWREVCDAFARVTVAKSEEEKHLDIAGGGEIDFWSADGGMPGEGRKYGLVVFDECAMMGAELERLWTRSLRPTLADLQGTAWFLSTSKAASSYFTTLFSYGQGERDDWKSWQLGTSENPYILAQEIESLRQDLPAAAFAQEVLGDAVSFSGSVFTNLEAAIIDAPLEPEYRAWKAPTPYQIALPLETFIGGDWAGFGRRAGGDFTTFIVIAKDGTICGIERFKADFSGQRMRLQALCSRYRPSAVLCEQNSIGAPQIEALRSSGLAVQSWTATNATKHKSVEALALAFEEKKIKIPDIENRAALLAELMAFEATSLPNGMTRFAAPKGGHDDLVIALMLAWNAANQGVGGWMGRADGIDSGFLGGGVWF
jgi:hypothetical protein